MTSDLKPAAMTDEARELRALLAKATPRPWRHKAIRAAIEHRAAQLTEGGE